MSKGACVYIATALFSICGFSSCGVETEKGQAGANAEEDRLIKFIESETRVKADNNLVFFLLHTSDCSCKDKNVEFVNGLFSDSIPGFSQLLVLKDDKGNKNQKRISLKGKNYFIDSTNILEKYGNVYANDKIIVISNNKIQKEFDINEDDFLKIRSSLKQLQF